MAPDKTIAAEPLPGRKKAKERITFMPCVNADGSEKFELMVIGHAWKPHVFKKKTGAELGFYYHANKKAWMTSTLFYDRLRRFHSYVCSSPGRKVLLLIDNCSAHGTAEMFPEMPNLRIVYLPPDCTSRVQPMDAGVIAALKLRYKKLHMDRALDNLEADVKKIYKVDVLTAMRCFKRAWNDLPRELIHSCWKHTGLLFGPQNANAEENELAMAAELEHQVSGLVTPAQRMSISELLNPQGENDCVQAMTDEEMVSSILSGIVPDEESPEFSDDETNGGALPGA